MKKYELQPTDLKTPNGKPLFQVVALRDFGFVKKGDKGGYIESTDNLSNEGNCWVFGDAWVFENAQVFGDAQVFENALVFENAQVFENAHVFGTAWVFGEARVSGTARVFNTARVSGDVRVASGGAFATKNDHWDITEVSNGNGTSTLYADAVFEVELACDHADWTRGAYSDGIYVDMGYRYCPKCGEEL